MPLEQTKSLLINIMTGAVIVGVIVAGYFVFRGGQTVTPSSVATPSAVDSAAETVAIGAEIARTVSDLQDLKSSVADSIAVFSTPAFKNLQDFSSSIPSQPVGRPNPFIPTDWKLKLKALQDAANKQGGQTTSTQTVSIPSQASTGTQSQTQTQPTAGI